MLGRNDFKVEKKIHKGTSTIPREVQILEENDIDGTLAYGLHCLFRHPRYLPQNPYKILFSILRRKERIGDLPPKRAYSDLSVYKPYHERLETLFFDSFEKSKYVSLSHNHKIISNADILYVDNIILKLHEYLGFLPKEILKGPMESYFIEVLLDCGGCDLTCGGTLLSPHINKLNMIVEGIFIGISLDDCLLSFIRRVFEEIDLGKKNPDILCSHCYAKEVNGNISIFSLEDIRNRKQLVLTTLKACIIEGGEISIQLFLKISRILPPNIVYPNHAHILCTELSTSYIQIHRRYHLTFIDSTSLSPSISQTTTPTPIPPPPATATMRNTSSYMTIFQSLPLSENILIRCFSPLPIDSLMRGLFQSIEDAERYRLICLRYSRALERNRLPMEKKSYFLESLWGINQKQDDSYYLQREELVMEGILTHYSQQALQSFENGNFVQAGRWLLSLQTILISSKDGNLPLHENRSRSKRGKISTSTSSVSLYDHSSHCMKQIAALSGQAIGKLNSIKNMIDSYLTCIQLYLTEYMETNPFFNHITEPTHHPQGGNNKSSTIENGLEAVLSQYETISLSLIEIKSILYGLYRDRDAYNSSVILLMIQEFIDIIDTFFQEDQTSQTILPTRQKLQQLPITSIPLEIIKSLRSLIDPLHQISLSLQFLCSSLGGDILLELLQMDYDVKYEYDLPSLTGAVKRTNNLSFDTQNERSIFTVPLLFSELLGYCQARVAGKPSEGRPYTYRPFRPGPITRYLLDRNTSDYGKREEDVKHTKIFSLNLQEYQSLEEVIVSKLPSMNPNKTGIYFDIFDMISGLSMTWLGRIPTIDLLPCHKDELKSYCELPPCIALEGTKLRYLNEAFFEKIAYESYMEACTAPERIHFYASFNSIFSRGASLLPLWAYNDDEVMENLTKNRDGKSKPMVRIVNNKVFNFSKIIIEGKKEETRGGIYGPKVVLQQLCRDWESILSNIWCLPPFLPRIPTPGANGITVEVMSGLSIETALRWGFSSTNSIFYPKKSLLKPLPKEKSFEKLVRYPPRDVICEKPIYPDSDDDHTSTSMDNEGYNHRYKRQYPPEIIQENPWNILSLGSIQMEIVYKYFHDIPTQLPTIRELFVMEIENSLFYMNSNINWTIHQIRIPLSSTLSPDDPNVTIFPLSKLRSGDEKILQNFRKRLYKVGLCWIDGVVLLPDPSDNEFMDSHSTTSAGPRGTGTSSTRRNTSATSTKSTSLHGKHGIIQLKEFFNIGKSSTTTAPGAGDRDDLNDEDDDDEEATATATATDTTNKRKNKRRNMIPSDWLGIEVERIVDGLLSNYEIQQLLKNRPKVYVPITLRMNLLSIIRGLDIPSAAAEQITNNTTSSSSNLPLLFHEIKKLTIGKSPTMARLISSTLWFTEDGIKHIWNCCKHVHSLLNCYQYESTRYLLISQEYSRRGKYVEAYERLCLSLVLFQQALSTLSIVMNIPIQSLMTSIPSSSSSSSSSLQKLSLSSMIPQVLRMRYGLPGIIQDILSSISIVKIIFQVGNNDGKGFTSIHTLGLAYTITRHISYKTRLLLMSSSCVHHPGGSVLILLKLKQLETILHLGQLKLLNLPPLPASYSMKRLQHMPSRPHLLPLTLPEYSSSTTTPEDYSFLSFEQPPPSSRSGPDRSSHTINEEPFSPRTINSPIEYEFLQSLSSNEVVQSNQPYHLLTEIETYLNCHYLSLGKDVHEIIKQENGNIQDILSSNQPDPLLQILIDQAFQNDPSRGNQSDLTTLTGLNEKLIGRVRARAHPGGSSSSSIAPTVPDVKSTNSIPSNILDEGEERRSRQTETTEEERLLTGVSVSSVLSMHEADFLGPFSNPSTNATSAIPAPISSLDSSQQNDQTSHLFQRKLDQEDLQDRMIALTFQREGARQRRPPHSRSNEKDVNIYTVRYDDNDGDEEEGQVGGVRRASNISEMGGGGVEKMNGITVEKWKKIKEVRTRASVLESLRRR